MGVGIFRKNRGGYGDGGPDKESSALASGAVRL